MMLLNLLSFVANHHPVRFFRVFIKLPLGCNRRGRFLRGLTEGAGFWYNSHCFGRKSVARVRESIAENYQKRHSWIR